MSSSARLAANRRNAQKSTGPTTTEGKAATAQNALRHGLTARQIVCREEREEDFAEFRAALWGALAPADAVEEQMAERIVLISWRLRRTARAERGIINDDPAAKLGPFADWIARAFDYSAKEMTRLARYEATLDRGVVLVARWTVTDSAALTRCWSGGRRRDAASTCRRRSRCWSKAPRSGRLTRSNRCRKRKITKQSQFRI